MGHDPHRPRRGTVGDRPWGVTLGSFATSRSTGQLTLTADDGRQYCVAFVGGAVVGASSPLASDSVARVALTSHLVSSSQVPALARAVAAAPGRDEVEVLVEQARLTPEQADHLRRRLLVQRAARTFSIDRGEYVFDEQITVSSLPGPASGAAAKLYDDRRGPERPAVDLGPAIYLGARMNLAQERLTEDLRQLGARFVLRTEMIDPSRFGLTDNERPILAALRVGTSLPELEAKYREIEPRTTQAVLYALVATELCDGLGGRPRQTQRDVAPAAGQAAAAAAHEGPAGGEPEAEVARARTITFEPPKQRGPKTEPRLSRTISSSSLTTPRASNVFATREVIASGVALLDIRADHFALLGVTPDATIDQIRAAYVSLACHLHPDKLPELDPATLRDAQRVFAHVNLAFGVLTDPDRRAEYVTSLRRGEPGRPRAHSPTQSPLPGAASNASGLSPGVSAGPTPVSSKAGTVAERIRAAADFAQRGMQALRREDMAAALELLTRATELAPSDVDYPAMLAWARFCAATDKGAIVVEVRRTLERAVFKSQKPVMARFYLGRVERMLGRVREALRHFHEVLELEPNHADAAAEIRLLEPRVARR